MNLQSAKARLLATQAELEDRLERTQKHIHARDEAVSSNFHEQVVEASNDDVVRALDQDAQLDLHAIRKALARIESGDYLSCSKCHKAIGEQRLLALPWTELCIDCA